MDASAKTSEKPEGAQLTKTQQLKKVFKEYGAVGVSFHICISLMSLGMFYLLISRSEEKVKHQPCILSFSHPIHLRQLKTLLLRRLLLILSCLI